MTSPGRSWKRHRRSHRLIRGCLGHFKETSLLPSGPSQSAQASIRLPPNAHPILYCRTSCWRKPFIPSFAIGASNSRPPLANEVQPASFTDVNPDESSCLQEKSRREFLEASPRTILPFRRSV